MPPTKETITSVQDLPKWFFQKDYSEELSDIEWFRQIRFRQKLWNTVEIFMNLQTESDSHSLWHLLQAHIMIWMKHFIQTPLATRSLVELEQMVVQISEDREKEDFDPLALYRYALSRLVSLQKISPVCEFFEIRQDGEPVTDLTVGEVVYLSRALEHDKVIPKVGRWKRLLTSWKKVADYMDNSDPKPIKIPYDYEIKLKNYLQKTTEEEWEVLNAPVKEYGELGNPFLSYGRPLNGSPITVDTQFDDEIIIENFKSWLKGKREEEGIKAKRPFTQKDFTDWSYYKVRQIWDLETWATINNVKILDRVLADAVWPNPPDSLSPIEVLRTTARKKVADVFLFETVTRFYGQLQNSYGENFLAQ